MRICLIADTHGKHDELPLPEADLLIHCGDMCDWGDPRPDPLGEMDDWFNAAPAREVICIAGNHDRLLEHRPLGAAPPFRHATYLEDSGTTVGGLQIHGAPWCPNLPGFAFYATSAELADHWRKIPTGVDILITHTPPFGILDTPSRSLTHLGCPILLEELKRIRPRLHVFGHVHAAYGRKQIGDTLFVNAASFPTGGHQPRPPWVVEM
ncbi:MAG: metallophosphatase domain-containing protein [Luteolibacter sp.]